MGFVLTMDFNLDCWLYLLGAVGLGPGEPPFIIGRIRTRRAVMKMKYEIWIYKPLT